MAGDGDDDPVARQIPPCDICGAENAPYGFQPPGGARNLKPGQRPLRACVKQACRDAAEERLQRSQRIRRGPVAVDPAKSQQQLI